MALRTIPLRRSLLRPSLLLGAERELVLMTGLVCGMLIFSTLQIKVVLIALPTWFGLLAALRIAAKADPIMSKVYLRHIRYKRYYPARSTPWRLDSK